MITKLSKFIAIAGIAAAIALVSVTGALAAPAIGAGPDSATAPIGDWIALAAGETHWYAFQYDGSEGQINVDMEVSPQNTVGFSVWTPDDLVRWVNGEAVNGIGRGSASGNASKLNWSGNFNTAGAYYVVVDHSSNPEIGYYNLSISGAGVSFPMAKSTTTAEAPAGQQASTEKATTEQVATAKGMGPADALAIAGEWMAIDGTEADWYAFNYAGDGGQVKVWLEAVPSNGVAFSVWTSDQVRRLGNGEEVAPVGRGSVSTEGQGNLSWAGSFNTGGAYYVVVEHAGNIAGPSYYALHIN